MHVLIVSPNFYPKPGGIESHLFELLHNLTDIQFTVLTNTRRGIEVHNDVFPASTFAYGWPADRGLRNLFARPPIMRTYQIMSFVGEMLRTFNRAGWLARLEADLIHFHYLELDRTDRIAWRLGASRLIPSWYRWIVSKAVDRAPVLFTDHTVFTAQEEIVPAEAKATLLEIFGNIISVDRRSHELVQSYQARHGGRSWFIPNSVDTDVFCPKRKPHSDFRVGFAARLGKAGQTLVQDLMQMMAAEVSWYIVVAGERIDVEGTELPHAAPGVRFFSNLDYSAMPSFYNSIDVLLNPFPGEGVGRTTLEAMSCGVPVIVVGSGNKYPIVDGKTGFMVPPEKSDVSVAIRNLKNKPGLVHDMGTAAREIVVREYSNRVLLPRIQEVYRSLVG